MCNESRHLNSTRKSPETLNTLGRVYAWLRCVWCSIKVFTPNVWCVYTGMIYGYLYHSQWIYCFTQNQEAHNWNTNEKNRCPWKCNWEWNWKWEWDGVNGKRTTNTNDFKSIEHTNKITAMCFLVVFQPIVTVYINSGGGASNFVVCSQFRRKSFIWWTA